MTKKLIIIAGLLMLCHVASAYRQKEAFVIASL